MTMNVGINSLLSDLAIEATWPLFQGPVTVTVSKMDYKIELHTTMTQSLP